MRTTTARRSTRTAAAAAALAAGVLGLSGVATAASGFTTLNDQADPTFNQLLGINDHGVIAGYFGSGAPGHPNKGYTIKPPYAQGNFTNENFPGSVQTQVTGLNNKGTTVGFYLDGAGHSFGFVDQNGQFTQVKGATQLLGINNNGVAVGFSTDKQGNDHAVKYVVKSHQLSTVKLSGNPTVSGATGINDAGDIAGVYETANATNGFLLMHRVMKTYAYGDGSNTQVFGVNNADVVVGFFANGPDTHGFVTNAKNGKTQQVDDPNAVQPGGTTVNGINNKGQIVGFYTDGAGNTDGFLAHR